MKNGAEGSGLIAATFYSVHPLTDIQYRYFGVEKLPTGSVIVIT